MIRFTLIVLICFGMLSGIVFAQDDTNTATSNEPIAACDSEEFKIMAELVPEYSEKVQDIIDRAEEIPAQEWWDFSDRVDVVLGEMNSLRLLWRWSVVPELPRCAYAVELAHMGTQTFSELNIAMLSAQAGLGLWHKSDIYGVEELTAEFLNLVEGIEENL